MYFAAQKLPVPPALPIRDLAQAVKAISTNYLDPVQQQRIQEILDLAESHEVRDPWVRQTKRWLRYNRMSAWRVRRAGGRKI